LPERDVAAKVRIIRRKNAVNNGAIHFRDNRDYEGVDGKYLLK
jgi:hypothetical protein